MRLLRILRYSHNGVAVDTCLLLNYLSAISICLLYKRMESLAVPCTLFLLRKVDFYLYFHTA